MPERGVETAQDLEMQFQDREQKEERQDTRSSQARESPWLSDGGL